jgi:hypothetical protein
LVEFAGGEFKGVLTPQNVPEANINKTKEYYDFENMRLIFG